MSSLTLRKFVMPEVVFGEGARRQAVQYLDNLGVNHALLVTDPGVIASGWIAEIAAAAEAEGIAVSIFSKISENPRTDEVESGAQVYRRNDCNGILAIGGGSSMDCAKGIAILSTNGGEIWNYEGVDQIPHMGPPLICIPTTAGSSADVSQFAIITDRNKKKKFGIISKTIIPDVSLVDPDMLSTLPRSYIAYCGFDALTHAIEAYVSTGSSHLTDLHALEAIRLIKDALPRVYKSEDDAEGTRFIALGSLHAGIAFSNASLGLVHAMAHPLSGVYDLPHGEMNSLLLPHIIRYNFTSSRSRYEQIARTLGVPEDEISREGVEALINVLGEIAEDVGITGTLSDRGVMKRDIPTLADFAVVDGCIVTNPRLPTWEEVTQIYEKAL
ncbi:MAG: iron-containing alcohol dehydrogenase [Methanocalculus sp.]|uniref:iron-containing alcohol dehydrogenase n=1 Tax=Methanocalculus sp. TaxID=2004547 RepID=UPI0027163790|nr:iron-containing alcohol dehydrogenase [Methanocalculus sp.]MDO9539752.1 iron-containing alcohol dehydrogenase [Methanocalculus sp.]